MSNRIQLLQKVIITNVTNIKGSTLSSNEVKYIVDNINKLSSDIIKETKFDELVNSLSDLFIQDLQKSTQDSRKPEPYVIDVHELMKRKIGAPETLNNDLPITYNSSNYNDTSQHNGNNPLVSLFGTNIPTQIQNIFNPLALNTKTYLILDRRYQSSNSNNTTSFTWQIANSNVTSYKNNAIGTTAPLKDIVSIKLFPFYFPNTPYAITDNSKVSIAIEEFAQQSYRAIDNGRRFHFMLNATQANSTNPNGPYILQDIGMSYASFDFYKPIEEINTITISFGNPYNILSLEPDYGIGTLSVSTTQLRIEFPTDHFLAVGDYVILSNFTTTNPAADVVEISLVNDPFGWPVITIVDPTTILLNIDLSSMIGTIIGNPYHVYFDSKRFSVRLEFTYKKHWD